jgi:alkyl hydroperoxide reductase subunit AhpF
MEPLLDAETRLEAKKRFASMASTVQLDYFVPKTSTDNFCITLLKELESLTDKIKVSVHYVESGPSKKVNENQSLIVIRGQYVRGDPRFYGIPTGHEFGAFLQAVILASSSNESMAGPIANFSKNITQPIKLEVFVTPECPHCPTSSFIALKLAILNKNVKGYVYEIARFPEVARKYNVEGVPKTVINEGIGSYSGGYPEDVAVLNIKKALENK